MLFVKKFLMFFYNKKNEGGGDDDKSEVFHSFLSLPHKKKKNILNLNRLFNVRSNSQISKRNVNWYDFEYKKSD